MEAVGYVPRTRLAVPAGLRPTPKRKKRHSFGLYIHLCPVCQRIRVTRQPLERWRCRACVKLNADRDGVLALIRRL